MQTSGNIEDLAARIIEKAKTEAEEIVERAEKVAVRDVSRVREELRLKQTAAEAELEEKLAAGREAISAENAIRERRRVMERQERSIEESFRLALDELSGSGDTGERAALLKQLTKEALDALKLESGLVQLNKADRRLADSIGLVNAFSGVKLELDDAVLETAGGVLVSDKAGRIFYDNTFEARLERMRPKLRAELAEVFGF